MPKDFGNLMRHQHTTELILNLCEIELEATEILSIVRRDSYFHLDKFINALHQWSVGKVKMVERVEGLLQKCLEAGFGVTWHTYPVEIVGEHKVICLCV